MIRVRRTVAPRRQVAMLRAMQSPLFLSLRQLRTIRRQLVKDGRMPNALAEIERRLASSQRVRLITGRARANRAAQHHLPDHG